MFRPKPRRTKLPLSQSEFDALADTFLEASGFPVDQKHRALFGAFIQHAPGDQDAFDPDLIARQMRKQLANELAFYLIYPDKRPKAEPTDGPDQPKETSEEMVQQTKE